MPRMRRLGASAERESLAVKRSLAEVEHKLKAIVSAIEDGGYTPTLKARLSALEQEKAEAEIRLRTSTPGPVLRLHTKLPELYRTKVERLAAALNAPDTVAEAAEILRGLIDHIVLTPVSDVLQAELHGDLAVLAGFAQGMEPGAESPGDSVRLSVVAGERNQLNLLLCAAA